MHFRPQLRLVEAPAAVTIQARKYTTLNVLSTHCLLHHLYNNNNMHRDTIYAIIYVCACRQKA